MLPCIVLAGGLGTRLRDVLPNKPKCLAQIGSTPFLALLLRSLQMRGVSRFILALGHCSDQVVAALSDSWAQTFDISCVVERESLGTGGAIRNVMSFHDLSEALVANGDTLLMGDLQGMLAPLNLGDNELFRMAITSVVDSSRFGSLSTDESGRVIAFDEKSCDVKKLISAGIYRVNRRVFEAIDFEKFSLERDVIPMLVDKRSITSSYVPGPFIDIGTPSDLLRLQHEWRNFC